MTIKPQVTLGKWRLRLWPVQGAELWKFLPLLFIKFGLSFNFTLLHSTKDTVTVTTSGMGAEAIPLLKGGAVMLAAFIFMLVYSKLSNRLSRPMLFYSILVPFIIFFFCYGWLLYPNRVALTPGASLQSLAMWAGPQQAHWVVLYQHWFNSLFFVMSELWGAVVIGVLFWGFANEINSLTEAVRFYAIYAAGGHTGVILAGGVIYAANQTLGVDNYELTLKFLMSCVTLIGIVIGALYWRLDANLAYNETNKQFGNQARLSLSQGLWTVLRSPYLGLIAMLVIGYSLSVNLVEVSWKALVRLKYPTPQEYQSFMSLIQAATGILSLLLALGLGGNIIRRCGWLKSAQITPYTLVVLSSLFFGLLLFVSYCYGINHIPVYSLTGLVLCGGMHNILCKSMKLCLFDPTKEMAYIPLDRELKTKGKAAVDVVASRLGKSGASWIQIGLIEFLGQGSILGVSQWLAPLVVISIFLWLQAVKHLDVRFRHITQMAGKTTLNSSTC